MEFKVNPLLETLRKAEATSRCDVVFLRGLVARTGKTSVAIRAGLFGASTYEVELANVISAKENADGTVAMIVRGDTPVVIHTTAGVMQVARQRGPGPTPAQVQDCIDSDRQRCINGALMNNPSLTQEQAESICDAPAVAVVRESFCRNPVTLISSGGLISGGLGSEVVFEEFG